MIHASNGKGNQSNHGFRATMQVVHVVSVKAAESNSRSVDLQLCHATVPCTGAHGDQDFQDILRENHTLSHQELNHRKKEQRTAQVKTRSSQH